MYRISKLFRFKHSCFAVSGNRTVHGRNRNWNNKIEDLVRFIVPTIEMKSVQSKSFSVTTNQDVSSSPVTASICANVSETSVLPSPLCLFLMGGGWVGGSVGVAVDDGTGLGIVNEKDASASIHPISLVSV